MSELLIGYLGSLAATLLIIGLAAYAFLRYRTGAVACDQERAELEAHLAKLPEAVHYADLSEKVEALKLELEQLKDDERAAQQTIDEANRLQDQISQHKEELRKLEAEREEQERLRAQIEALRHDQPELEERHRKLKQEAEAAQFEGDQLQERIDSLRKDEEDRADRLQQLEHRLQESGKREAQLESRINTLTEQADAAQQQRERLEQEVTKFEKRRDSLEGEVNDLSRQRKGLQDEVRSLETRVDRLKQQVDELHLHGDADPGEAGRELWNSVLRADSYAPPLQERNEKKCLEHVQEHLERHSLRFPERTIHALHTSLKIADMSPLVVLAGISGTGKSELPRRYAEAMGIHFLPVAVQPRWDSPQDLFGFFNYLEGRFRPTELTRALIQMDPYGNESGRGWQPPEGWNGDLGNQMLLVLLDEMNLARVEYYFSDLLSKLETRRGIDPSLSSQRQNCEIMLELGRGGDDGESNLMRLFVDTNVLFVGTMNEDETTQTLSDKVVDRANLLRFGKPRQLFAPEAATNGQRERSPVLEYGDWKDWLTLEEDFRGDNSGLADAYLTQLNELMAAAGRPFAFRLFRAMRAYVANYPSFLERHVECAVADQIEQRILPRLRGLDLHDRGLQDALDGLRKMLREDELHDPVLLDAIEEAADSRHHQFNWQGVDRSETDVRLAGNR